MTKSVDELRGLKPPASARVAYGHFVSIQEIYAAQLRRAAAGRQPMGTDNPRRTHELTRITQQLGLTACQ
jgi:hypothetical protein